MRRKIELVERIPDELPSSSLFSMREAMKVYDFHRSFPQYEPTPLRDLRLLAKEIGLNSLHVKDESYRFGLNAFKVLGGSYALGSYLAKKAGLPEVQMCYEALTSPELRERVEGTVFATATDGNHGRGVAWSAREYGLESQVFMPKGSALERLENIRKCGAKAEITDLIYDDTVRYVAKLAQENGWVLTQDTTMPGYDEIPRWIMQGYMTMALEAIEQLGDEAPTHVFLQAGVGSMAGALAGFFAECYEEYVPEIIIVEPHSADCFLQTAKINDGRLHKTEGDLKTIMAGLACGEVCEPAWYEIARTARYFVSMDDFVAADGMRVLGAPIPGDHRIISGESGASTTGLVYNLMVRPEFADIRDAIGLDQNAEVLCFNTEGATDLQNYRKVVWQGAFSE